MQSVHLGPRALSRASTKGRAELLGGPSKEPRRALQYDRQRRMFPPFTCSVCHQGLLAHIVGLLFSFEAAYCCTVRSKRSASEDIKCTQSRAAKLATSVCNVMFLGSYYECSGLTAGKSFLLSLQLKCSTSDLNRATSIVVPIRPGLLSAKSHCCR